MNELAESFTPDQKLKFDGRLMEMRKWFLKGQHNWSAVHHLTTFLAIVSGAAAAVIPQLRGFNEASAKDWTTILAAIATVLISLSKGMGFERKWRASRLSRNKVQALENELMFRELTMADVATLNKIAAEHDSAIIGGQ